MITEIIFALCFIIVGFVIGFRFQDWYYQRYVSDNSYRIDMARMYHGKKWAKAIVDCDKSHLAGDCVLCGGESATPNTQGGRDEG